MTPRILDAGDSAVTVEFGRRIDAAASARVLALDAALAGEGILETVPTYRALMVHYDPLVLPRDRLLARIAAALEAPVGPAAEGALWLLPACVDARLASDLPHVAAATGLAEGEVLRLVLGTTFRVAMFGFAPGWAYLSGLPAALALPRRATPRAKIPAGAVIVAGGQAIVAGPAMPSGWHVIGRTPEAMFAPGRTPPVLLAPGDRLRFQAVDLATFAALEARVAAGEVVARRSP